MYYVCMYVWKQRLGMVDRVDGGDYEVLSNW